MIYFITKQPSSSSSFLSNFLLGLRLAELQNLLFLPLAVPIFHHLQGLRPVPFIRVLGRCLRPLVLIACYFCCACRRRKLRLWLLSSPLIRRLTCRGHRLRRQLVTHSAIHHWASAVPLLPSSLSSIHRHHHRRRLLWTFLRPFRPQDYHSMPPASLAPSPPVSSNP